MRKIGDRPGVEGRTFLVEMSEREFDALFYLRRIVYLSRIGQVDDSRYRNDSPNPLMDIDLEQTLSYLNHVTLLFSRLGLVNKDISYLMENFSKEQNAEERVRAGEVGS